MDLVHTDGVSQFQIFAVRRNSIERSGIAIDRLVRLPRHPLWSRYEYCTVTIRGYRPLTKYWVLGKESTEYWSTRWLYPLLTLSL